MVTGRSLALGFVLAVAGMAGCADPDDADLVILPLGDSLTRGKYMTPSYRYYLAEYFEHEGIAVDFIGRLRGAGGEGGTGRRYDLRAYPQDWDDDHEGHGGATWADVANLSSQWFTRYRESPDIILLMLGTNDANQANPVKYAIPSAVWLWWSLKARFPDAEIVLGLPPPLAEPTAETLLRELRAELRASAETEGLWVVDFTDEFDAERYLHPDGVHLTPHGDMYLARGWARSLLMREPFE